MFWTVSYLLHGAPLSGRQRSTLGQTPTKSIRRKDTQRYPGVKCDDTTMTQDDIDNGRLVCEVGVAPVRSAEFALAPPNSATFSATLGAGAPCRPIRSASPDRPHGSQID